MSPISDTIEEFDVLSATWTLLSARLPVAARARAIKVNLHFIEYLVLFRMSFVTHLGNGVKGMAVFSRMHSRIIHHHQSWQLCF